MPMQPNQQETKTQQTKVQATQNPTTTDTSQPSSLNSEPNQLDFNPKNIIDPFSFFKKPVFVIPLIISAIILIVGYIQPNEDIKTLSTIPMVVIMPIIAGVLLIAKAKEMAKKPPSK